MLILLILSKKVPPQVAKFRITNPHGIGCGKCIKGCPWNKPEGWIHDLVRWMIQHTPFLDKAFVKMDDIWGYGKQDKKVDSTYKVI